MTMATETELKGSKWNRFTDVSSSSCTRKIVIFILIFVFARRISQKPPRRAFKIIENSPLNHPLRRRFYCDIQNHVSDN